MLDDFWEKHIFCSRFIAAMTIAHVCSKKVYLYSHILSSVISSSHGDSKVFSVVCDMFNHVLIPVLKISSLQSCSLSSISVY
jgi:hypothetical protein